MPSLITAALECSPQRAGFRLAITIKESYDARYIDGRYGKTFTRSWKHWRNTQYHRG